MTLDQITAELTDFFQGSAEPETIRYMAEQLHENGLTLETATEAQLNNLLRGEHIDAWH